VRKWLIIVCAVFGSLGCAETRQYFRPTEHVYGETARGDKEAIYALVGRFGPFGEAKVWSRGAFVEQGDTVLFATIDLHNTSGVPIVVDPQSIRVEPARVGKQLLHDLRPREQQKLSVAPGAFGSIKLRFVLPRHIVPGQVSSFGLRWAVANGPQSYSQRTPFLETRGPGYGAYPVYPASAGYGYGYGAYGYGCAWADPLCRGPYGYGAYGVGVSPSFTPRSAEPARPARERIRVR
jgi:hypothetical protein